MNAKYALFAALSGAFLGLAFPPYPFGFLAIVAFVPILFLFETRQLLKHKFLYLYITFFLYHAIANWWIGSWQSETDPYLTVSGIALCFAHPFFFFIPFWFYFHIRKSFGSKVALWTFPLGWVAFEWLHSLGEASYPWLNIGYTQLYNTYWIQFIDITGIWGASLLLAYANIVVLMMILNLRNSGGTFSIKQALWNRNKQYSLSIIAIFILPLVYGYFTTKIYSHENLLKSNPSLFVGIVQPNINPWRKWDTKGIEQVTLHKYLQDSLAESQGAPLDLCVWSETAIPYISLSVNYGHFYPFITEWLNKSGTALLTGFSEYYVYPNNSEAPTTARAWVLDESKLWEPFNTALLLNPPPANSLNPQIYRKSKLTPFAERFPYADKLSFTQNWLKWGVGISSWGIGKEQYPMKVKANGKEANIGSIICIESIYPNFCAGFVRGGADILAVITNDAWYDFTVGPSQHYDMSVARAIENRRYIVRAANTGISGFISPTGASIKQAAQYQATAISELVPLIEDKTLYTTLGDWLPEVAFIISLIYIIIGIIHRKRLSAG